VADWAIVEAALSLRSSRLFSAILHSAWQ